MQPLRLLTNLIYKFKDGNLHKHKAPSERELAPKATEGECVIIKYVFCIKKCYFFSCAGSFHHYVVPLPLGGRLIKAQRLCILPSMF